ncbi:hypothetical protein, partial [Thiolapillus sp.]|uniref:hypothetical protein n=1 Tax=Thiolapillus sp. TaxID=2017437 RepID=UPI003AF6AF20
MFKSFKKRIRNIFHCESKGVLSSFTLKSARDWRIQCDESVPPHHADYYDIEVHPRDGASLDICVTHRQYPSFGMSLIVEINQGVPCIHVSNDVMGDNALHLFATQEGIAVAPDDPMIDMERQPTGLYYPGSADRNTLFYHYPIDDVPDYQACLRPRDRFWDIPVPKIDSAFDNLFVPQPSWSPSTTQQL